jgi:N-methylhydantoinase B
MHGGKSGRCREDRINGNIVNPKGRYILKPGDIISTIEAGDGGFGNPLERSPEKISEDVKNGFVTIECAWKDYGVKVDPHHNTARRG